MNKKSVMMLLCAAALGFNSCNDIQELNVDFGDRTYVNEYNGLIDAVNNLSASLQDRFNALSELLKKGMADLKVSIDENTGAITVVGQRVGELDADMKDGLGAINTTLFEGFKAVTTQIDETGKTIIAAMDNNGNLLRLQIDETGKLISAQLITSTADLIKAMSDNTASLAEKLGLIKAAVDAGFASAADAQKATTEAVKALQEEVAGGLKSNEQAVKELTEAIKAQTTSLEGKIALLQAAIETGFANDKAAIDEMAEAIADALASLEAQVKSGNTTTANYLSQLVTAFSTLNTNVSTTNTKLGEIKDQLTKELADNGVTINSDGKSIYVTPEIWNDIEKSGFSSQLYQTFMSAVKDVTVPKVNNPRQVTPGTWHSCAKFTMLPYDPSKVALRAATLNPEQGANGKTVIKMIKAPSEVEFRVDGLSGCSYPYIYNIRVHDARGDYQVYGGASGNAVGTSENNPSTAVPTSKISQTTVTLKCYDNGRIIEDVAAYVFTYSSASELPTLFWPSNAPSN